MKPLSDGLRIIECSGTAYEIGLQYGAASKDNLRKALDLLICGLKQSQVQPHVDRGTIRESARKYFENVRAFDPEGLERIRGVADGADISFDDVFAVNCYTELVINYPNLAGMCTSFALAGPATKDGLTILGQNIDWHPETPLDLLHIKHSDGLEQLSIAFFGAPCYSLTSAGIGNSANLTLSPMGPVTTHIPLSFYLYSAMRKQSFGEAFEVLQRTARGIGYYHLADAAGNMGGIESVYDGYTVLEPDRGVMVHANHYETSDYAESDGAHMYIQDSFQRAPRLRKLIDEHYGMLTPEIMMTLLADHDGYPNSICRHADASKPPEFASVSMASVIMTPAERKMYLSLGPPCGNKYQEYSLGEKNSR